MSYGIQTLTFIKVFLKLRMQTLTFTEVFLTFDFLTFDLVAEWQHRAHALHL